MAKRKAGRASAATRKRAKKTPARKAAPRAKATARKTAKKAKKAAPRKAPRLRSGRATRKVVARKAVARKAAPKRKAASTKAPVPVRKAPALNRPRRTVVDEDIVQTPPSSLDLDRTASAVRTGRRAMKDRFAEHTETSPALTGGDVDADWESAYSVGDEAPGGDNPTPDQDIVDDIGKAVGIEYQDNEELKGAKKVEQRDKKRWELDPASAEDWEDR